MWCEICELLFIYRPASGASKKDEAEENAGEVTEQTTERPPSGRPQSAAKSATGK